MNLFAPISDRAVAVECDDAGPVRPLSAFAPGPAPRRSRNARTVGIAGVVVVHALLAALYVFGAPSFARGEKDRPLVIVQLPPELAKPLPPPPPPNFRPLAVYVPVPVMPEITLSTPPPPPVITDQPSPPAPASLTAPLAAEPVPFDGHARASYVAALFKHLNAYKRYPEAAKLRHEQGLASLRFTINRDGHVLAASISKSSGSKALDEEVLAAVKRADPLPGIPAIFGREQLDLVIPVEFVLR